MSVDDFRSDNYGSYKDGVNKEWAPSYRRAARVLDKMGRLGDFGIGLLDIYNGAMTLGNLDASSLERSSGALNMANGVFATAEAVGALAGFDSFAAASGAVAGAFLVPMAVTSGALMFKNASRKVTDEAVAGDVAYDNYNASLSSDAQQRRVDAVENYIDALPPEKRPHSVVLNNKVADTFNQIGGPYRTSSGQFDPQDQGKTPRKDWLVKPSDVVMNSARTDHMDYDGDKPDLSTEGQLKLPDMLIDDKKGKYSRTVDHGERFEAQGYQSRGGPEFQRHYSGRNWGQQLGGEMQRRFPPDDPRAGITTLDAGRGYWEKPVNDRGDWNLALLDDQEVRDKALFPHSIRPRDPGYAESDPSHEAAQAREAFKEAQAQWADAFPASDDGVPLVRNPQPFERNFATSTQRRTVIQAGAIDHDLRVRLKHPDDRMLFSKTPDANVTVTLPPKGGGRPAIDVSGIVYRGGPAMTKLGRSQDAVSYQVWNGRRFSVRGSSAQLDALEAAIEAQLQASPKGPR